MAVQVMIDGQGVEVAAVVPWPAWLALADVARGLVPHLFDDLAGGVEGGDGSGFGSVGGDGSGDDVGRSGNAGHIGAIRRQSLPRYGVVHRAGERCAHGSGGGRSPL